MTRGTITDPTKIRAQQSLMRVVDAQRYTSKGVNRDTISGNSSGHDDKGTLFSGRTKHTVLLRDFNKLRYDAASRR